MYKKDFDGWIQVKKRVNSEPISEDLFYHEREVWWCALGINVGSEIDGKHQNFERPVLVIKKINREQFYGIAITSKHKSGKHYVQITYGDHKGTVCLSQLRNLSSNRLLRKIDMANSADFQNVIDEIRKYLFI